MDATLRTASKELEVSVLSGWLMLPIVLGMLAVGVAAFASAAGSDAPAQLFGGIALEVVAVVMLWGFFTLQPNESRVLILFGNYRGTVRQHGFHWGNPFYSNGSSSGTRTAHHASKGDTAAQLVASRKHPRMKVSLRSRNLNGAQLKVNDKQGNPIDISAVIVWRVQDTAQAMFDVDDYEEYVSIQSESALRHLCSQYAYDHGEEHETTLRSGTDEVSQALTAELQQRLSRAGVAVEEARLNHLAYAPEVAQAMLRRQQAEAVLAARTKIVQGAVSMVQMALEDLEKRNIVTLDAERKAAMVSNLLVVLCGDSEVRPMINTGTLHG
jgi:regulator of protease activity HflC (stomatin/prohibitin superfamily)